METIPAHSAEICTNGYRAYDFAIIALATGHFKEIATAMHEAAARHGYPNQTLDLGLTNRGAEVITG